MPRNYILSTATTMSGDVLDVIIEGGKVVAGASKGVQHEEIDCTGLVVLPGFVDLHTHLREPGFEQSETVASGSRSAAAGDTQRSMRWQIPFQLQIPQV